MASLLSFFLIFISLQSTILAEEKESEIEHYLKEFLAHLNEFLLVKSNWEIISKYAVGKPECAQALLNVKFNATNADKVFICSGKTYSDVGIEEDCINLNMTYLLLTYEINFTKYFREPQYRDYFQFLNQHTFYTGLCLWKECNEFYKHFFNMTENEKFSKTMEENGIINMKLFRMDYMGNEDAKKKEFIAKYKMDSLESIIWVLYLYLIFRVIVSISSYFIYEIYERDEESLDVANIQKKNLRQSVNKPSSSNMLSTENNPSSTINFLTSGGVDQSYKISLFYNLCSIFSLRRAFSRLFKLTSKYYNEADLQMLSGIRVFLLFFITLNNNTYALTRLPHREVGISGFFSSFWFMLVKFGAYSFECYKALNGVYFGFKLLSFIKRRGGELNLRDMMVFFGKCVPQLILFLISLFCFHLYIMEIGLYFDSRAIFEYFIEKNVIYKDCLENPSNLFIPFYYPYFTSSNDYTYPSCFKNFHFAICEFMCFSFILIMTYILLKVKNKYIELGIYIVNIIAMGLSYFSYQHDIIGEPYIIHKVYETTKSFLYPHLFFNLYFLGFNAGIVWFYYKDITSSRPANKEKYIPYSFNYNIMRFLDRQNSVYIILTGMISLVLMFIISLNFYILLYTFKKPNESPLLIGNAFMEFIFEYAGQLFGVLFLICVISLLFSNTGPCVKAFFSNQLFLPVNRISFAYFCIFDVVVYLFYALYNIEIYMNFHNTVFITLSLVVMILLCSIAVVILCELPVRILYRKLTRRRKIKLNLSQ